MIEKEHEKELAKIMTAAMDSMNVAVTLIDTKGVLMYYKRQANRILDRQPEYI